MGATTTNLSLYKPTPGSETGWGEEHNANLDTLDTLIASERYLATYYVDPNGSNSNDGLSWATAKKDVVGAIDTLIGLYGNDWSATIYFKDLSYVDSVNTDRGLWLAGANDTQYNSLPTGWRKEGHFELIGIPVWDWGTKKYGQARLRGGSATDETKPLFWFSGSNKGTRLANIYGITPSGAATTEHARPMILGLNSTGSGDTNNSGFVFENVVLAARQTAGYGPCVYDYSSYWLWANFCSFAGNATEVSTADKRASWLIVQNDLGEGLKYWKDVQFAGGGGIKHYSQNGGASLRIEDVVQEGLSFGSGDPSAPIYWKANAAAVRASSSATITNVEQADAGASSQGIVVVEPGNDPGTTTLSGFYGTAPRGPMTLLGNGAVLEGTQARPSSQRAMGIDHNGLHGPHDGVRRAFPPTAVRFVNRADQNVANWSSKSGTATVTTGKTAPDGGVNAAELSGTGALSRRVGTYNVTPALNDWIVAGVYMREVTGWFTTEPSVSFASGTYQMASDGGPSAQSTPFRRGGVNALDQGWIWSWSASKVSLIAGAAVDLNMDLTSNTGKPIEYCYPVLYYIPASAGYDDGEILEWAENMVPTSNNVTVGDVGLLRNQAISLDGVRIVRCTGTPEGAVTAPVGSLALRDDGGASTTLYVKQSGTGNTGWVAK